MCCSGGFGSSVAVDVNSSPHSPTAELLLYVQSVNRLVGDAISDESGGVIDLKAGVAGIPHGSASSIVGGGGDVDAGRGYRSSGVVSLEDEASAGVDHEGPEDHGSSISPSHQMDYIDSVNYERLDRGK